MLVPNNQFDHTNINDIKDFIKNIESALQVEVANEAHYIHLKSMMTILLESKNERGAVPDLVLQEQGSRSE